MIRETVSSACQRMATAGDLPPDIRDHVSLEEAIAILHSIGLLQEPERGSDVFLGQVDRRGPLDILVAAADGGGHHAAGWHPSTRAWI